jgi:hypothetical protein
MKQPSSTVLTNNGRTFEIGHFSLTGAAAGPGKNSTPT